MIRTLDSLVLWLGDFYFLSAVLLAITLAVGVALRQPAKRLAVIKAMLVALAILAVLCALPRWSVVHLRTAAQPSAISNANPHAAAFAAASNLNANTNWPTNDALPLPSAKPASDAATASAIWQEIRWQQVLVTAYVVGAVGVVGWLIIGQLAAIRLRHHAQPAPADLIAMLEEVAPRGRVSPRLGFNEFDKTAKKVPHSSTTTPLAASFGETGLRDQVASTEVSPRRELESASRRDAATWSSLSETRTDGFGDTSLPGLELLVSARIAAPVALGLFHPAILLPKDFADTKSAIRNPQSAILSILAHELAHIRNHDLAWLAVSRVLLVLLWAQPLYWLVRRRMRFDQETLADAAAAELTSRQHYAEQLVAWARSLSTRPLPMRLSPAVGLWEGTTQLRRRITMLVDNELRILGRCSRTWRATSLVVCAAITFGLSLITIYPARTEPPAQDSSRNTDPTAKTAKKSEGQTVKLPIVVAKHVLLLNGKEIITWDGLDKRIAALADPSNAMPQFYFTSGARESGAAEVAKQFIWELHKKYKLQGHSEGSLWPRAGIRYDRVETEADLHDESRRVQGRVLDAQNKPIADAEVIVIPPVDESISYKAVNIALVEGRVRNRLDEIITDTNSEGRYILYLPKGQDHCYILALHPNAGIALIRFGDWQANEDVMRMLPWAKLEISVGAEAGTVQSVSLSTRLRDHDGYPELVLSQYWSDLKQTKTTNNFQYSHVPPIWQTSISRDFAEPGGGTTGLDAASVSLLPGESRQIGLGTLSDKQREWLKQLRDGQQQRLDALKKQEQSKK